MPLACAWLGLAWLGLGGTPCNNTGMRKPKRRRRRRRSSQPGAASPQQRSILPQQQSQQHPQHPQQPRGGGQPVMKEAPSFRLPSRSTVVSDHHGGGNIAPVDFAAAALHSPTFAHVPQQHSDTPPPPAPAAFAALTAAGPAVPPPEPARTPPAAASALPRRSPPPHTTPPTLPNGRGAVPVAPNSVEQSLFKASLFHFHPPVRPHLGGGGRGRGRLERAYAHELEELGMDSLAQELRTRAGAGGGAGGGEGLVVGGAVGLVDDSARVQDPDDIWGALDDLDIETGDDVTAIPLTTSRTPSAPGTERSGSGSTPTQGQGLGTSRGA